MGYYEKMCRNRLGSPDEMKKNLRIKQAVEIYSRRNIKFK